MLVLEYLFSQTLIFFAFGIGLDPRQAKVFGPALAPILIGCSLGLSTLASALIKPGYSGVCACFVHSVQASHHADSRIAFNPARCIGLMTPTNDLQYHYVHWLGPLTAAMANGLLYYWAPPYMRDRPLAHSENAQLRRHHGH